MSVATINYRPKDNFDELMNMEIELDIPSRYIGNCRRRYCMMYAFNRQLIEWGSIIYWQDINIID